VLLLALAAAGCQVPDPRPGDIRRDAHGDLLPPRYTAPAATVLRDVSYGPLPEHRMDVHLPRGRVRRPLPVLVYLHSGGWVAGDKRHVPEILRRQVHRHGMALVSVNYRLVERHGDQLVNTFPAAIHDVDRVLRHLRHRAGTWGLDAGRIVLSGGSAGGHLALLAATAPGRHVDASLPEDLLAIDVAVSGVVSLAGPSDLTDLIGGHPWGSSLTSLFLGCVAPPPQGCPDGVLTEASPMTHLSQAAPPAYLAYGAHDTLVPPVTQGRELAERWHQARAETAQPGYERAVWYDEVSTAGHNLDHTSVNVRYLELWLAGVLSGRWRPAPAA